MGVKYAREYNDIIGELSDAIVAVDRFYELFDLTDAEWSALDADDRTAHGRTLADDIFYGLGAEPMIEIGTGTVTYDRNRHTILVSDGSTVRIIRLI